MNRTVRCPVCTSARVTVSGERVDCAFCGASVPLATLKRLPALRRAVRVQEAPEKGGNDAASERAFAFADWFRKELLPEGVNLPPNWREKWARCYDEMVRLDGRTPEQIAAVCRAGRKHDFWQRVFLYPPKLRDRKDGVQLFDRLALVCGLKGAGGVRRNEQIAVPVERPWQ